VVPPQLARPAKEKSAGEGGSNFGLPASLSAGTAHLYTAHQARRRAIPSTQVTVVSPARTTCGGGLARKLQAPASHRPRSAGNSQGHSLPALVSGSHRSPTLWTSLWQLLFL